MPTKKPRVQALINEDIYETFKEICQKEERSESNMAGKIIAEYVKKYAKETMENEIEKTYQNESRRKKLEKIRKHLKDEQYKKLHK